VCPEVCRAGLVMLDVWANGKEKVEHSDIRHSTGKSFKEPFILGFSPTPKRLTLAHFLAAKVTILDTICT
jgi:hypothetical protein